MTRIAQSPIARGVTLLSLTLVLLYSCQGGDPPGGDPPNGIEGTGFLGTPPVPAPVSGLTMTTARSGHTATLLQDGKVLIAGGAGDSGGFQSLASAEVYDPSSGTFTATGDMTVARAAHTATLLTNGKVLIAEGVPDTSGSATVLLSAEIYDPVTGTFTATGNMISNGGFSAGNDSAILLPDGRVFIAAYGNAEIYDPVTGTFALTGAYSSPVGGVEVETATLLPDGKVLVVGFVGCAGQTGCFEGIAELFDPKTDTFSPTQVPQLSLGPPGLSGPTAPWAANTLPLTNGSVLLIDGNDEEQPDDVQVYDPASGTFTHIGFTLASHEVGTATRLPDGRVLIAGGQVPGGNGSTAVELYAPATGKFALAADMTIGRSDQTATLLADGTVLIAGGWNIWPHPTASAEIYKYRP